MFQKATRRKSRLRMTIDGPAGSGKTYTALRFAHTLTAATSGRIAYIDTERGSASKYVGEAPDGIPWDFDVVELSDFSPEKYTELIEAAGKRGYSVLVIDSLSHAWEGKGGALDIKDRQGGNQWTAWRAVTPIHGRMVDSILQSPCHVITTMRSRMEYVQETDDKGKVTIKKVGMAPVQRPGMEYEFDIVCDMDWAHILSVSKSRCSAIADLRVEKPGQAFMAPVLEWLNSGVADNGRGRLVDPPAAYQTEPPANTLNLDNLLALYDAEKIIIANEGRIPATEAEVLGVAEKLAANG